MATLVLRTVKGSPLTNAEVDGNFSNINSEVGTVFDRANTINSNVGILSNLTTTEKSNLVAAINEIASESTSNVTITGGTIANVTGSNITITSGNISGTTQWTGNVIGVAYGGTGANTASAARTSLGLGTIATQDASNVNITGGNFTGNVIGGNISGVTAVSTTGNVTATYFLGDGSLLSNITSSGGGSGLFNTSINEATGYTLTESMANAYVAPSTTGYRYLVHSIHVTNISGDTASVNGQIVGTTYSSISFGNTIPVPAQSAVELLKKPKILQPGDYVQLSEEGTGNLHATITVERSTDTKYFGSGIDLTSAATYTDLLTASANSVIESILLTNDNTSILDVKATVVWTDGSNNIQGYYCYDLVVPNDATIEVLDQPKFIPNGYKVRVLANQADRLEATVAGKTV